MFKLNGTLKVANGTQVINEKFSKREFVIETKDQYPQLVMFQLTQDKCELLSAFKVGNEIEVSFNLRGREWASPAGEVKYFNTLEAWRLERIRRQRRKYSGQTFNTSTRRSRRFTFLI
jgi:hypothetical protein